MSATNRGAIRNESDFYRTPEYVTQKLIDQIDKEKLSNLSMLEPFYGDGAIAELIRPLVKSIDWAEKELGRDYFLREYKSDLIITNPPFSLAKGSIEKSLNEARFVAMLLRINFLGSQDRQKWWIGKEPTHLFTLSKRPAFVAICKGDKKNLIKSCGRAYPLGVKGSCECGGYISDGTDATEYAWFVWDRLEILKNKSTSFRFI